MQNFTLAQWALAAGLAVALVSLLVGARFKQSKSRSNERVPMQGPASLKFSCSRCSVNTFHTRRTINAWQKGSRSFFCNNCHKNWREAQVPSNTPQSLVGRSATSRIAGQNPVWASHTRARQKTQSSAKAGCFSILIFMVAIPALAIVAVLAYA